MQACLPVPGNTQEQTHNYMPQEGAPLSLLGESESSQRIPFAPTVNGEVSLWIALFAGCDSPSVTGHFGVYSLLLLRTSVQPQALSGKELAAKLLCKDGHWQANESHLQELTLRISQQGDLLAQSHSA